MRHPVYKEGAVTVISRGVGKEGNVTWPLAFGSGYSRFCVVILGLPWVLLLIIFGWEREESKVYMYAKPTACICLQHYPTFVA